MTVTFARLRPLSLSALQAGQLPLEQARVRNFGVRRGWAGTKGILRLGVLGVLLLVALPHRVTAAEGGVGHVTGIGGVFVKSRDPKALAAWYHDMLGITLEPWGGAVMRYDAPMHPPKAAWMALPSGSKYFAPSSREFKLDFAVDDIDILVARLTAKGVKILKRDDSDPSGRFAWILDPDGTKIELWQAKKP
jgi:predicted enzyme related to lactoylglutathione lyase